MCDFISWINNGGDVYFLTDKEIRSPHMKEVAPGWNKTKEDVVGHGAISAYYNVTGVHKEDRRFWEPDRYPESIARCIKDFEQYFSRMFRECVTEDRVANALLDAPKPWKKRLLNILKRASKARIENIQCSLEDMLPTKAQWAELSPLFHDGIASPKEAFDKILSLSGCANEQYNIINSWVKKFTSEQRVKLLLDFSVSLDCFSTLLDHIRVKDITAEQVSELIESLYDNTDEQHVVLLKFGSKLSQNQIKDAWFHVASNSKAGDLLLKLASKDTLINIIHEM